MKKFRPLPVIALILPFYVMTLYGGLRSVRALWPVLLVAGLSFALSQFVASNFLSEEVVRSKIAAVDVASRIGSWLRDPGHATRVTAELANLARAAVAVLRDDAVQSVLEQTLVRRVVER